MFIIFHLIISGVSHKYLSPSLAKLIMFLESKICLIHFTRKWHLPPLVLLKKFLVTRIAPTPVFLCWQNKLATAHWLDSSFYLQNQKI